MTQVTYSDAQDDHITRDGRFFMDKPFSGGYLPIDVSNIIEIAATTTTTNISSAVKTNRQFRYWQGSEASLGVLSHLTPAYKPCYRSVYH